MCVGSGASWESLQGQARSSHHFFSDWDMETGQSDLWLVATCAGLGGTWEWLCCKLRLVAACARFGTLVDTSVR